MMEVELYYSKFNSNGILENKFKIDKRIPRKLKKYFKKHKHEFIISANYIPVIVKE